jgi:hypothetical protein
VSVLVVLVVVARGTPLGVWLLLQLQQWGLMAAAAVAVLPGLLLGPAAALPAWCVAALQLSSCGLLLLWRLVSI